MFANLSGWHLIAILAIVLLIFGAAKLPTLARSVGQSVKIFKGEMRSAADDDDAPASTDAAADAPRVTATVATPATVAAPAPVAHSHAE